MMVSPAMGARSAARVLAVAALLALAHAGCYRDKSLKKKIPHEQKFFNHKPSPLMKPEQLPKSFDWCNKDGASYCTASWNQHISSPQVQEYCGSCFLHGTLSMIQDRLKIKKGAQAPDIMLGRQTFLNCAPQEGFSLGCDGGDVIDVVKYMAQYGLPDEGCMPYAGQDRRELAKKNKEKHCPAIARCINCMIIGEEKSACWAVKTPVLYKVTSYGVLGAGEAEMMSEIFHRGPITCSMAVTDDFAYGYRSGVWRPPVNSTDVDHDVEVVGWGEENGVKYWKVRNSWGSYWGELGFFKIERGINALELEAGDCWYAEVDNTMEQQVMDGELVGSMWGVFPQGYGVGAEQMVAHKEQEQGVSMQKPRKQLQQ